MKLSELTLHEFISKVAGKDPVPGGGSVSALCGSLAAALGTMVCGLTIGKKKYEAVSDDMAQVKDKIDHLIPKLLDDIDLDSEAYDKVFNAFQLPKDDDAQKAERTKQIQAALRHAADVPMNVAKTVEQCLPLLYEVAEKGNKNAITDACVAMMCARTAILGALLNVRINLSSIKDAAFVEASKNEADRIEKKAIEMENKLMEYAKQHI